MEATDGQISAPIQRYADHWWPHFNSGAASGNVVVSPVGAWLLLALAAGADAQGKSAVLGLEPGQAMQMAAALVGHAPKAVRAATALWLAADERTEELARWQDRLPAAVASGPVPTAQQADDWASAATGGLINRFPVTLARDTALVLAGALVADVRWRRPYLVRFVDDWGIGRAWAGSVESILVGEHLTAVRTDQGLFAVHQAQADGLVVICVTGATASHPMSTAAAVLRAYLNGSTEDLWTLPLGEDGCWRVEEELLEDAPAERVLRTEVRLPAWEAESSWDLMTDADLGFVDAAQRIAALLVHPGPAQAAQRARARFDRLGFTAAAVTALAVMRSAPPHDGEPTPGVLRRVRADFAEPFAAFALVDEPGSPWHQVMAFAAWIQEPADPQHT